MKLSPILPIKSKDYGETVDNDVVLEVLKVVQEELSKEEVSAYKVESHNRESLQQLELEEKRLSELIKATGVISLIGILTYVPLTWLGVLLTWKHLTRLEKVIRMRKIISAIVDRFGSQKVETLPFIKVPGYQPIDLFVRFPGKEFLLFAVRSFGNSEIVYKEKKGFLYYVREKNGIKQWNPDPMLELSEQAYWLHKNRRELFGSSKGVRKPLAKVLVIYKPTRLAQHPEHLYTDVGGQKFLFIPREAGACYAIDSTQVVDFIQAWLVHRQSSEKSPKTEKGGTK